MTPREIRSAMKRLFYGDLPEADPWQHVFNDQGILDETKCRALLATYIDTPDVLLYGGTEDTSLHCSLAEAPKRLRAMLSEGRTIRVVTPDFQGRAVFNAIGVATGRARTE
jgi:hypothetical protein